MGYTIWINLHHKISIQTLENAAASGPQRPLMHCLINCCSHRRWQGVFQSRSSHTGNISCSGSWHSIHADLSTETSTGRLLLEILSKLCRSISNASLGPSWKTPRFYGAFTMDKKAPMFYQSLLHLGFLAGCHHWRLSTFGKWSQLVRQSHRMLVGKEFSYAIK